MSKATKGILSILLFELCTGVTPVIIKQISPNFPTSLLLAVRFAFPSLFFLLIIASQKKLLHELTHLHKRKLLVLVAMGIISSGLGSLFYVITIRSLGASLAALLENLEIPVGILLATIFLKERLTKLFSLIALVILVGFYLLISQKAQLNIQTNNIFLGTTSGLAMATLFGIATNLGKIAGNLEISSIISSLFRNGFGAICNACLALFTLPSVITPFLTLTHKDWLYLLVLGIPITGIGFMFYYYGLRHISVKKVSLFFVLAPVVTLFFGIFIGERLTLLQWIGTIIILGGISLLIKTEKEPLPVEEM